MIEVKGTKTQNLESDPAQRYVLKSLDKKSKVPAIISAFMVGLFVYLKSAMSLNNQTLSEEKLPSEPENKITPEQDLAQSENKPATPSEAETYASVDDNHSLSSSPVSLIEPSPPQKFIMIESPILNFTPFQSAMPWLFNKIRASNEFTAANDNPNKTGGSIPSINEGKHPEKPVETKDGDGEEKPKADEQCNDACPSACDDEDQKNRPPTAKGPVYLRDITGCSVLVIGLADLLQNIEDPDGDALSIQNITVSSGTITPTNDGWVFQPEPQLTGIVTISYEVSDGEFFVTQTAQFRIDKTYIVGTEGDDDLIGTECADDIDGSDGDDNIEGLAGDDTINGGKGDDFILGGSGKNTIFGGLGNDIIYGGQHNDHISGGDGDDFLYGGAGNDIIFGDAGNDFISGEDGRDILFGGAGNDTMLGGAGSDNVYGEAGDDHIIAALDNEDDIFDGGTGCDILDYSAATAGLTIDLVAGTVTGEEVGCDTISNFETIIGGIGDDHFILSDSSLIMIGGEGENIFDFSQSAAPADNIIMHEIIDFKYGDRIKISKYDIFERAMDKLEDRFEEVYGDDFDDDNVPLIYRHDTIDGRELTVIEADLNRDDFYETSITLDGHRMLVVVMDHA